MLASQESSVAVEAGGGGQEEASWRTRLVEEEEVGGGAFKFVAAAAGDDLFAAGALAMPSLPDPPTPPSSKEGIAVVGFSASPYRGGGGGGGGGREQESGATRCRGAPLGTEKKKKRKWKRVRGFFSFDLPPLFRPPPHLFTRLRIQNFGKLFFPDAPRTSSPPRPHHHLSRRRPRERSAR